MARDRRWLTEYWIKPNEKMRAKAGLALQAKFVGTAPVIDGDGGDAVWAEASRTSEFRETFPTHEGAPELAAPEVASSVSVLADEENLYFLIRCKEPSPEKIKAVAEDGGPVYEDDAMELMLFPPSEANTYFQVCVNAKGKTVVLENPAGRQRPDIRPVAAGRIGADEWTAEVRIPVARMYPLAKGDVWRVMFMRDRTARDRFTPKSYCPKWSFDGGKPNNPSDFLPMYIGTVGK